MNKRSIHIYFLVIFFISACPSATHAQKYNIDGDTIYVNAEAEVMIRFPSLPSFFNVVPSTALYNIKTVDNGFTVVAKSDKAKPATLFVKESDREHHFLLAYKKDINYSNTAEIYYDYSSKKKLKKHIKEVKKRKEEESKNAAVPANQPVEEKKKKKHRF